jgi:hypothetical protein
MIHAEVMIMRRRILCLFIVLTLAIGCTGCNLIGDTMVLDNYPAQNLYATYTAIRDGTLKVRVPRTETIPNLTASMIRSPDYYERMAELYLYNESSFYITVHGYAWIGETTDPGSAHKAIYFNNEKNVSNATYNVRLDPGSNTYLLYEVLFVPEFEPTKDSVYFLFFRHEDTEYVGAATAENEFVYWPLSQTIDA